MESLVLYIESISNQALKRPNRGYKSSFEEDFNYAVNLWLKYLFDPNDSTEVDALVASITYTHGFFEFWKEIYSQSNSILSFGSAPGKILYSLILRLSGGSNMDMKIIVVLALIAVSTSYTVLKLQKLKQRVEEPKRQDSSNSQHQNFQVPPTVPQKSQNIPIPKKYSLIVAISASKEAVFSALSNDVANKRSYEELYKATQSLSIFQTEQVQLQDQTSKFNVAEASEYSEYDVYLVKLDLRQRDDRFGPNQDQMDRYDAFRNLPNLVTSIDVSKRLTMDVCTFFKLYVR